MRQKRKAESKKLKAESLKWGQFLALSFKLLALNFKNYEN
jgi:hypothetical protein